VEPRKIPTASEAVDAERREQLAALVLRRTALSPGEAALLREVFPALFHAHHAPVRRALWKRGAREDALEDLVQEVFFTFFVQVVNEGFPESPSVRLQALAAGKAWNLRRRAQREPLSLGLPSSRSEKPRSGPGAERALDLGRLYERLLPALSPEHQAVVEAVIVRELSHDEAAAELGIARSTLTSRLMVAKQRLAAMAVLLLPPSQRGPS
jgi:DNA-directed RNA polymerase specialized sigma24 family protein